MDNIFKPIEKKENTSVVFEGVVTATAWLEGNYQRGVIKDCNGDDIPIINVDFLKDDNGDWKKASKLIKSYISKLKNPVMVIKEFEHDFVKTTTPNKVMKFAVVYGKKPTLGLGISFDGSKVLKGISSDDYYFYHSDIIRFMIFDDSVEKEKKMREIL